MAAIIPIIVGLVAAGAVAFGAGGGKSAAAAPAAPAKRKPKKKAPTISDTTEAAIVAAMKSPQAMQGLIATVAKTGDPVKLWNLGRTILVNNPSPTMKGVGLKVLVDAVTKAASSGKLGDLVANALANGDGAMLASAAKSAARANPSLASALNRLVSQLTAAKSPGQPAPRPPSTRDEKLDTKAAQAATAVVVDAIKRTGEAQQQSTTQTLPTGGVVTTLPEIVITASPDASPSEVLSDGQSAAMQLTDYLRTTSRYKEDNSRVGQAQKRMGLSADGKYGPGSAKRVASFGVVPVPPFYWTKGKAPAQKKDYKDYIASMAGKFPDQDWSPALKGVDQS